MASDIEVPVRWSDMDAYGHVNNVQFLRLLEDARIIAFREWFGIERDGLLDTGVLVTSHHIDYLAPLTFNYRPVIVRTWVTHIGGASVNLGYEVRDCTDNGRTGDALYAKAETSLVAYSFAASAPRRLAPDERERLTKHLAPAPQFRRRG